ncbi:elongation factor 1-gamma (EF-1-gamma) [Angomonas deanei]|uniref:Glutathione S-transferase, N-terminal domain containing protein, putative n=1 Tax=Angomonas deanei TaxID=59799 RepID=A0A7G2CLD3_9TRYP|nr:elongation factor 1-gamma (EF-1-gamma) [Angomonas deanei]CAD2220636.1 Glutathione S-transferase, N-terminal domain containing protein, putative [Angomonas deanei]|eukprot:EPY32564.1 elongation factor 1-gamma (EF-1-gamma) [Angomonas deanei]
MVVSLIGPIDHPLTQRILLIAAFAGVKLKLVNISADEYNDIVDKTNDNKANSFRLNCHPMGRFPVLKTDEGYMFDCNSIIRYIARTEVQLNALREGTDGDTSKFPHPDYAVPYAMYGHGLSESALVDSWLDYISKHFDIGLFNKDSKLGEAEMQKALEGIELKLKLIKDNINNANAISAMQSARSPRTSLGNNNTADIEQFLEEMNNNYFQRNRKVSAAYNISGNIKNKINEKEKNEQLDSIRRTTQLLNDNNNNFDGNTNNTNNLFSARASTFMTPRMSTAETPRMGNKGKTGANFVFLVNESLTAADLAVFSILRILFDKNYKNKYMVNSQVANSFKDAQKNFPETYAYYKTISTLPLAAEMSKILGI